MMDKNKEIFLAGADVLVYLAEAMHKKYSTTSVLGHLSSTYVSYDRFFNPLLLYVPFGRPPLFLQLVTYLTNDLFLNKKKIISTF